MLAVGSVFIVVVLYLIIVRVATVALVATGLPMEVAQFQALSGLTGVGFTTGESETVVGHPVRRRIQMTLMVLGSAGLVAVVGALLLSLPGANTEQAVLRVVIIVAGLLVIAILARSPFFNRVMTRAIQWALHKWTDLDVRDYVHLLQLTNEYAVDEIQVLPGEWATGRTLDDLHLPEEGLLVLGIQRAKGEFIGAPRGTTLILPFDELIIYGRTDVIADFNHRPADSGDLKHSRKVSEWRRLLSEGEAA